VPKSGFKREVLSERLSANGIVNTHLRDWRTGHEMGSSFALVAATLLLTNNAFLRLGRCLDMLPAVCVVGERRYQRQMAWYDADEPKTVVARCCIASHLCVFAP